MKTEALKQALDRYAFDVAFGGAPRDEELMRVFPLSNWTEYDVREYIAAEEIDGVPLYFAAVRPVVRRGGVWIVDDDERLPLKHGERRGMQSALWDVIGDGSDQVGCGNGCQNRRPNWAPRAGRSDQAG